MVMEILERIRVILEKWFGDRTFGAQRSGEWSGVRREHINKFPLCAVCGKKKLLMANQVHHCLPFHLDQTKELDPDNLITLCRDHHFLLGHLQNFKSYNSEIKKDAEYIQNKIKNRP